MENTSNRLHILHKKRKNRQKSSNPVHPAGWMEQVRDVIFQLDANGVLTHISPSIEQFGLKASKLRSKTLADLVVIEEREHAWQALERAALHEEEVFEFNLISENGRHSPVIITLRPFLNGNQVAGYSGVLVDISTSAPFKDSIERRAAHLNLLNQVGSRIASALELTEILTSAVQLVQKGFGYYHVAIFTPSPDACDMDLAACAGALCNKLQPGFRLKKSKSTVGWVCENRSLRLINHLIEQPPFASNFPETIQFGSELCVPILNGEELLGVLQILSPLPRAFDDHDARVIETVANQLAIAIQNSRLYDTVRSELQAKNQAEQMVSLQRDLLVAISATQDFQAALEQIISILSPLGMIDSGSLYLFDPRKGLIGVAHVGLTLEFRSAVNFLPLEAGKTRFVLAGQPGYLRYADLAFDPRIPSSARDREDLRSVAVIPILYNGELIASLTLGSHTHEEIPLATRGTLEAVTAQLGSSLLRVQVQIALSESEARNQALLEAIPDMMFQLDAEGCFIDTKRSPNPSLLQNPDQYLGKHLQDILPAEVADLSVAYLRLALESKSVQEFEYTLTFPGAEKRQFEARLSAASDSSVVGIVRDITERKRTEQQIQRLLQLEKNLSKIQVDFASAHSFPEMMSSLLKDAGSVLQATRAAFWAYDAPGAEFKLSQEWNDLPPAAPDETPSCGQPPWAELVRIQQPVILSGAENDLMIESLNMCGVRAVLIMPVLNQDCLHGALVFEHNLQIRKWAAEEINFARSTAQLIGLAAERFRANEEILNRNTELEKTNQRLVELERLKSQFLANISHELRTPLNSIIGFSEVLSDEIAGPLNIEQKDFLADIHRGGVHLLSLVNDLLDFSKIEANRMNLDFTTFSVASLVDEVRVAFMPLIDKAHQTFTLEISPDLPQIRADRLRLKQILFNLIGNANKFTPANGRIQFAVGSGPEGFLFSVRDSGPGIRSADHELIFEEFRQSANGTAKKEGGTGLGLAITRRLVEMHGGRIWVESQPGEGAAFFVRLPIH